MSIFSNEAAEGIEESAPFAIFAEWLEEARASESTDPEACAMASTDADGCPNVRMLLVREVDERGFVFNTNLKSVKGVELHENPQAALCFHWKSLERQVRVRGRVSRVDGKETDAYFAMRPRGSRIGAWASKQSKPLEGRFALESRIAKYTARYALGEVPRPDWWGGFRLRPVYMEFWQAGERFRLHERVVFTREENEAKWSRKLLFP